MRQGGDVPVNAEDVVQHLVEEHQRHVQLLLVEDLQTGLHVVPELLLLHGDVVLQAWEGTPVSKQTILGLSLL